MATIDKAALIEAAAKAIHDVQNVDWRNWGNTNQAPYLKQAKAALPVIARELLAPLRELHKPLDQRLWAMECVGGECGHWTDGAENCEDCCPPIMERVCAECYRMGDHPDDGWEHYFSDSIHYPCPTVRLLDQIEADLTGGDHAH